MRALVFTLCLLSLAVGGVKAAEWRDLSFEEEEARTAGASSGPPDSARLKADFDGDGTEDEALILMNMASDDPGLVAHVDGQEYELAGRNVVEKQSGLRLARVGRWDTVCSGAFRQFDPESCKGYPAGVTLKQPGILLVTDGRTTLFFWNSNKKAFDAVALAN
jgi:hypothetical protein